MEAWEFDVIPSLPSDEERWVLWPPGVGCDLLGLADVKQQIVQQTGRGAGSPLIVWYKIHYVCVVCKYQSRV